MNDEIQEIGHLFGRVRPDGHHDTVHVRFLGEGAFDCLRGIDKRLEGEGSTADSGDFLDTEICYVFYLREFCNYLFDADSAACRVCDRAAGRDDLDDRPFGLRFSDGPRPWNRNQDTEC